uniref:Uncharacterized protein n=1 Tax=Caenorhabditis japonica TaxID=281687 RepID=A0A8R1IUZ6_CAEJA
MELAKKINTSQPEVRAATDYEWERFFYFNETMETFFSEIKDLPSNFSFEKQNLESFGLALSHLDNVHFPNIPFHRIAESLIDLKSTVIGKSREISSVEESFEKLRDLQYAVIRKEKVLSTKLQQADLFYHCYFVGKKEYQSTW